MAFFSSHSPLLAGNRCTPSCELYRSDRNSEENTSVRCISDLVCPYDKHIHWWKSVRFKKNSLFSTGKQQGSKVKGHMLERVWCKLLLLNTADGLDLRGLAVRAKLPEVFVLPTVTIALHDILVSTITRILVAHKSVEK